MFVLIVGPIYDLEVIGPFKRAIEAFAYTEKHCEGIAWALLPLTNPVQQTPMYSLENEAFVEEEKFTPHGI